MPRFTERGLQLKKIQDENRAKYYCVCKRKYASYKLYDDSGVLVVYCRKCNKEREIKYKRTRSRISMVEREQEGV